MDLTAYDVIVINSSGGKDSQAMLWQVFNLAWEQRVAERLVVVHADLGRVEWEGTRELAERQASILGLPFIAVSRAQDLLDQVEQRGMWPSSTARYCTSDHKRDQIAKVFTRLVRESGIKGRPVRILNCMGLRAAESPARALKAELAPNTRASNGKRVVTDWLPIHGLSEAEVWQTITESPLPVHPAYAAGMPRLSCCFCVLASKGALVRAAQLNPTLAATYAGVEARIGHRFRNDLSMADVIELAEAATEPVAATCWTA